MKAMYDEGNEIRRDDVRNEVSDAGVGDFGEKGYEV